jgi:mannose-6-phosphate isomerase-like protein (cupin superfamily)
MNSPDPIRPLGLIGGIGLTEVTVYSQHPAPDGQFSGCPHVHAVTDEGHYVLRGTGFVEFHDTTHGFRTVPLAPGDYLHFPPLVMHRLVSTDGLVILGIMGNAGLAERGEARVNFGADVDARPDRYAELMALPRTHGLPGALDRRDASVRAYMQFVALWRSNRDAYFAELRRFIQTHRNAMALRTDELSDLVRCEPVAWAIATQQRIDSLAQPTDASSAVFRNAAQSESALGMCGTLRPMLRLDPIDS